MSYRRNNRRRVIQRLLRRGGQAFVRMYYDYAIPPRPVATDEWNDDGEAA